MSAVASALAVFGICCYVVCVLTAWIVRRLLPPFYLHEDHSEVHLFMYQ